MLLPQCNIQIYSYCNKLVSKSRMEVLFFSRSRFQAESSCKQLCIGYLSELFINIHCDDEQTTPASLLYIVFTSFAIQSIVPYCPLFLETRSLFINFVLLIVVKKFASERISIVPVVCNIN